MAGWNILAPVLMTSRAIPHHRPPKHSSINRLAESDNSTRFSWCLMHSAYNGGQLQMCVMTWVQLLTTHVGVIGFILIGPVGT